MKDYTNKKKNSGTDINHMNNFSNFKQETHISVNNYPAINESYITKHCRISQIPTSQFSYNKIDASKNSRNKNRKINTLNIDTWEKKHDNRNKIIRGALDIIKSYSLTKPIAKIYERIMDHKEFRELTFPLKSPIHTIAALDIGLGINDGNNLSSTANRFATKYDELYTNRNDTNKIKHGSNAIRHTIWQGILASQYNAQIARDAGDAHETRPYCNINARIFTKEADADMVVDLLNNKIGRQIGTRYPNSSRKDIALRVLEEYRQNGLYSYKQGFDGLWYIEKTVLPSNIFYELYNVYRNLNNYGK